MLEQSFSKLDITPKLIDFGDKVLQTRLVTSVGLGTIYPMRPLAKFLAVIGGVCALAAVSASSGPFRNASSIDGLMWMLAALSAVGAVAAYMNRQELLIIRTAGGEQITLVAASKPFLKLVTDRIREAMIAPIDAPIHYTVNVTAEKIETLFDQSTTTVSESPGAAVVMGDVNGGSVATAAPANTHTASSHGMNGHGAAAPQPYATPAASPVPQPGPPIYAETYPQHGSAAGGYHGASVSHAPGAIAIGGSVSNAAISTNVVGLYRDIDDLVALVQRSGDANAQQITEYLRALKQMVEQGPARAGEARQAWTGFFNYAVAALTGVSGLIEIAERVNRWFNR